MEKQENTAKKFAPQGKMKLVKNSITQPEMAGLRFVLVPASEDGKPTHPIYDVLDKKWPKVKAEAKGWYASRVNHKLGCINTVAVQSDVWVVYMLYVNKDGAVDEKGLAASMKQLVNLAKYEKASVHISTLMVETAPTFGELVQTQLIENGISVNFYEEPMIKNA